MRMRQSGATAAILAVAAAALVAGAATTTTATSTSHVVSGSTSRLPMGLSEVITDLEAEGAGNLATAAFLTSRSVCRSRRAVLLRSLFGVTGDGEEDHQVQDGSTTAFGKRMGGDDDAGSRGFLLVVVVIVVANACGRRGVAAAAPASPVHHQHKVCHRPYSRTFGRFMPLPSNNSLTVS